MVEMGTRAILHSIRMLQNPFRSLQCVLACVCNEEHCYDVLVPIETAQNK